MYIPKIIPVTYPDHLGDPYTSLGTQTLAPKKYVSCFLFQLYFNKNTLNSNQLFYNASKYFEIPQKTKMQTKEKNKTKSHQSKRRDDLQKCFHSSVHFFLISFLT